MHIVILALGPLRGGRSATALAERSAVHFDDDCHAKCPSGTAADRGGDGNDSHASDREQQPSDATKKSEEERRKEKMKYCNVIVRNVACTSANI